MARHPCWRAFAPAIPGCVMSSPMPATPGIAAFPGGVQYLRFIDRVVRHVNWVRSPVRRELGALGRHKDAPLLTRIRLAGQGITSQHRAAGNRRSAAIARDDLPEQRPRRHGLGLLETGGDWVGSSNDEETLTDANAIFPTVSETPSSTPAASSPPPAARPGSPPRSPAPAG